MNLKRASGILIAAASMLAIASCSHRTSTAGEISTFVLPAHEGHEARWPGAIAAGPDHALWFTELDGASIGRIAISPLGEITEYAIPVPKRSVDAKPGSIALGP